ncbi:hypothetical protein QTG54_003000 [Skeletonema marinoi]|uniref:Uncharacterized protein n=1 Tax=Skeletonema marinoi TaxID=267567 RepID=A0AAD8YHH3_9STRA|nr:hypothetical protein QTG54_003000 [Skeletonema marinoi]
MQDAKSSSTLSSLSQNIPIQQSLEVAKEVPTVSNITETDVATKRDSPVSVEKDSPSSLGSSGSRQNSFTRWKSMNSSKSQDSASASSGSYYKGVLARAAAMNQDEDNDVQPPQDENEDAHDVVQLVRTRTIWKTYSRCLNLKMMCNFNNKMRITFCNYDRPRTV